MSESHPEPVVPADDEATAVDAAEATAPVSAAAEPVETPTEAVVDSTSDDPESDGSETDDSDSDDGESDEPEEDPGPPEPTWTRIELGGTNTADAVLNAVEDGGVVVLPTDTVYGIGVDAYNAAAVGDLLTAKGRGRDVPPPVLIGDGAMLKALAQDVPDTAEQLIAKHWPGPLTVIVKAAAKLKMDLGETGETIGVRVPDQNDVREILRHTGPMAVSSANKHGEPAATTIDDAIEQLGNAVKLYVDGGDVSGNGFAPSTMVDFSKRSEGVILRVGAIDVRTIRETLPEASTLNPDDDPDLPEEPEATEDIDADETATEGAEIDATEIDATETDATETDGDASEGEVTDGTDEEDSTDDHASIAAQIRGANEEVSETDSTPEDKPIGDEPTKAADA